MRNYLTPAIAMMLALFANSAQAQDALVCHHAGLTYSPGSVIAFGANKSTCQIDGRAASWTVTEEADANCTYDGEEYSRGARIVVDVITLNCASGQWYVQK